MSQVLRWGIASAGKISNDFVKAVQLLPEGRHEIVAVAARKGEDAEKFAAEFSIPRAHAGYEKLAEDPDVDIVYIGSIHSQHYSLAKLMLEHDKHILCEKVFMLNLHQTKDILRLAKERKRFCMEAIWSRFFPAYERIREAIRSGEVGEVQLVRADFGLDFKGNPRIMTKEMGGGALLDTGIYCMQLATMVMDESPEAIAVTGCLHETGVDRNCAGSARYSGGRLFQFCTHTERDLDNKAVILGSKGRIDIPFPFWCPPAVEVNGKREEFPVPTADFIHVNSAGLAYQADGAREAILRGELQHELCPWRHTEIISAMLDECRRQLGFRFDIETPASA